MTYRPASPTALRLLKGLRSVPRSRSTPSLGGASRRGGGGGPSRLSRLADWRGSAQRGFDLTIRLMSMSDACSSALSTATKKPPSRRTAALRSAKPFTCSAVRVMPAEAGENEMVNLRVSYVTVKTVQRLTSSLRLAMSVHPMARSSSSRSDIVASATAFS